MLLIISIHALLAESDIGGDFFHIRDTDFYPRSPCGERQRGARHANNQQEFLSTLSLRRATSIVPAELVTLVKFLSTLSLRRATRQVKQTYREEISISIHALLAESDNFSCASERPICNFYPRSPCGERLSMLINLSCGCFDFYPRSPCGERPNARITSNFEYTFLSTLSLRRATN